MPLPVPNARSRTIEESLTLAISARAARMKAAGQDVVSLGAGEPDFPVPTPVAEAGVDAIRSGRTRYTPAAGVAELRAAGARWLADTFGIPYTADEVMATAGAKAALHMALSTIVEKGDVVLVLAPFWVSYPALVRMADGVPVVLDAVPDSGFLHAPEAVLAAARKHGAKGIILNFPNNPSGVVPSAAQVQAYVDVARQADLWILSDEIYGQLTYDGTRHVSPAAVPGGKERTIVVNGFTKSHTLTGWRISFLAGPKPVIDACTRIQSQVLGNACTISQEAAIAACRIPLAEELQARLRAFDERRRFLVDAVNAIPRLRASMPRGAFYVMLDVRNLLGGDDVAFAERLLDKHLLAGVPGSAFGAPGFLRLSYAASKEDLQKAVDRLRACVEGIR